MPTTQFRLLHGGESLDVDLPSFQSVLPPSMSVVCRDDAVYVEVQTPSEEDARAQFHVDRELDRLFFLTCVRVKAEMCTRRVQASFHGAWSIHGSIPPGTVQQDWNYVLGVQLRLWAIASELHDPIVKIIVLYQIIELAFPNPNSYPVYTDASQAPHPRTECRLLRHLVVHAGEVTNPQLQTYCTHLGLPPLMLDRTDSGYVELLSSKCQLVEQEAKLVLQRAL